MALPTPPPTPWYIYLVTFPRAVLVTLFIIPLTVLWASAGIIGTWLRFGVGFQNFVMRTWCQIVNFCLNIHTTAEGFENIPEEGVLFLFNHTSFLDIPAFQSQIPVTARFGAKIELFKVPFFGACMRAFGVLPIVRKDREKVLDLYRQSIESVHLGRSYTLAGEGTRHGQAGVGERFKAGPFIFALEGQFPIVPYVIKGAYEIMTPTDILPGLRKIRFDVKVRVLPPVPTQGLGLDDRQALQEKVRRLMVEAHQQM